MSDRPKKGLQTILDRPSVGGNLTVGDIEQILNCYNSGQIHFGSGDNVAGDKYIYIISGSFSTPLKIITTLHNIPRTNTIKFVGRAGVIEKLNRQLNENNQIAITAVKGMGGVGKTELAIQYSLVYLLTESYEGGICWLKAREENIGLQIVRFAQTYLDLNCPEDWNLERQVKFVWSHWQSKKSGNVLVVIDDVTSYKNIKPYLPLQGSIYKVLITSRLNFKGCKSLLLDVLEETEAINLLREWLGENRVNEQIEDVKQLCWRLGYLPLALNLVGAYLQEPNNISITKMLTRLDAKGLTHKALMLDEERQEELVLSIERGVAAAFELSWQELNQEAQQLGCLLSLFALASIPLRLLQEVKKDIDEEELEERLRKLERLHLIQKKDDVYQLHQLIREFFQSQLAQLAEADEYKRRFCQAMAAFAKEIPETLTQEQIREFAPAIPHLTVATRMLAISTDARRN